VDDAGQDASPLSWSAQVNVTVTSEWFQPAAFGVGDTCATIVGGVRSSLTCAVIVAVLPSSRSGSVGEAGQTKRDEGEHNDRQNSPYDMAFDLRNMARPLSGTPRIRVSSSPVPAHIEQMLRLNGTHKQGQSRHLK